MVGKLMSDSRFIEAVLIFLESTQVGLVKKGVIVRGGQARREKYKGKEVV